MLTEKHRGSVVRGPRRDSGRGKRGTAGAWGPGRGQTRSRRRAGSRAGSGQPDVSLLPSGSVSSSAPPSLAGQTNIR